ncbi:YaiO family outer membrane beta-barrel protein [Borborobacter arsenicus]|uniref:YaiO family outer membrane beta-barrel protein n=1 Tax=Borborobacter arsenicus TaxID=1851146 RepID=UPI00315DD34D
MLALAPNYADAKFGMAMIEFRSGKLDAAQALAEPLVREHPGNSDFGGLLASIRKGQRRWRLDLGSEISDLSGGRSAWTDSSASLSYRVTPDTTVGVRSRVASRYGQTDLQIEGRIDQAFSPLLSGYGLVAATPQAAFLARFSIGAGASWRALPRADAYGPVFLNLDARYDRFAGPDVATIMPWVQAYMFEERLGISARWVHAQDDEGTRADGYVLRADFVVTPRLNVFGGYADAPEISDGTLVPTRSVFAGASYDISDTLTLHGSFAHEQRPTFDRDTFGFSLTARF